MVQLKELLNRDEAVLQLKSINLTLEDIILICTHICSSQILCTIDLIYNNIGAEGNKCIIETSENNISIKKQI